MRLETADIDAPDLCGIFAPRFLYADDLILMSTSPEGFQRQLDALASFCEQRQLTVNLSKTKVVIFEARKSDCKQFDFSGTTVERHDEYRYLGFVFHATKNMAYGVEYLVAAAKKAVHGMRRRCISLHLSDAATICKLFDILVLPISSYSREVWAVNPKVGAKAELVYRQFLKELLGVRKSTTTQIGLAEFGRFPLHIHCWQHILCYHNQVCALSNSRLDKLALIDGFWDINPPYRVEALSGNWRSDVRRFVDTHGQQIVCDEIDNSIIVKREKARWVEDFIDTDHSSLQLYRTVYKDYHSDDQYSDCLSIVRCYPHRRLISRFRCGCHGLHVDTACFGKDSEHRSREDRVCLVCMSGSVEDEHHFLSDCPAYNHIRQQYSHLFHSASPSVAASLATDQPNVVGSYLKTCFAQRQSVFSLASELCRARLV